MSNTSWIPDDCRLPDSIEEIERGRQQVPRQRELFGTDDVMTRLRRIKANEQAPRVNRYLESSDPTDRAEAIADRNERDRPPRPRSIGSPTRDDPNGFPPPSHEINI